MGQNKQGGTVSSVQTRSTQDQTYLKWRLNIECSYRILVFFSRNSRNCSGSIVLSHTWATLSIFVFPAFAPASLPYSFAITVFAGGFTIVSFAVG